MMAPLYENHGMTSVKVGIFFFRSPTRYFVAVMQRILFFAALIASAQALPGPNKETGHSTSTGLNPSPTVPTLTGLTFTPTLATTVRDGSTITYIANHPNVTHSPTSYSLATTVIDGSTITYIANHPNATGTTPTPAVTDGLTPNVETTSVSTAGLSSGADTTAGTAGGATNDPAAGNSALPSLGAVGWSSTMYGLLSTFVALTLAAA